MIKNIFFAFCLVLSISTKAQEIGPLISFETTLIDYGIIESDGNGMRTFGFKNIGDQDLIIKNVQSSCGCTIPKKPAGPIAPGEKSEIVVQYDTKREGPFRKTITVTTNIEKNPISALKIKGTVISKK
tara:strand:+ start:494 stop:877 length:384 start_codon:yes stop_codon:yes gene_type:complete